MQFYLAFCVFLQTIFFSAAYASPDIRTYNTHKHESLLSKNSNAKFGFCDIEIINDSDTTVYVSGQFDDGSYLLPFNIYPYEAPHYVSLYYYGYCHSGMYLTIRTRWSVIYSGYTPVDSWLTVYNGLAGVLTHPNVKSGIRTHESASHDSSL